MQIITEMVNGPCPFNQRTIHRFRTDAWMGFIRRNIDDIDSCFLKLSAASLDYILGLMEGEGSFPLESDVPDRAKIYFVNKFIASNLTPRQLMEKMALLVKRLMMHRLMLKKQSFRREIYKKV